MSWCNRVGRSSFSAEELTENVFSVVQQIVEQPDLENWQDIMQLYVCTGKSVRLPIYQTFPDPPHIESGKEEDGSSQWGRKRHAKSRRSHQLTNRLMGAFAATGPPEPLPVIKNPDS